MFKYLKSVFNDVHVDGRYFFNIVAILILGQFVISLFTRVFLGKVWGIEKFILDNMYRDSRYYVSMLLLVVSFALATSLLYKLSNLIVEKRWFERFYKR